MQLARMPLVVALLLAVATTVPGQITSDTVLVGGLGTYGCQDTLDPPRLSNGDLASATLDYTYDQSSGVLTLVVTNTTTTQLATPAVVTDIRFNVPAGVTALTLQSQQQGSGPIAPDFQVLLGTFKDGCLGDFTAHLGKVPTGIAGGIGNASAANYPNPQTVTGPVTFKILVSSANPAAFTAASFVNALSTNGMYAVPASMKFQGSRNDGSGKLGGCIQSQVCTLPGGCGTPPPVLTVSSTQIGGKTTLAVTSAFPNAPLYLLVSVGPVTPISVPIPGKPACVFHVNPANFFALPLATDANGNFSISWIPKREDGGLVLTLQAYVWANSNPPSPIPGDHFSNGMLLRFGCGPSVICK